MRAKASRFAVAILAVATSLLLLELGLRAGDSTPVDGGYARDPILPFKPRPGSVLTVPAPSGEYRFEHRHNVLGFRDVEHAIPKPTGVFRIVALGDSFTYGLGAAFEDTYPSVLERFLNEHARATKRVEIVKMGIPRYYPELEALVLRSYGLRFEPDLVLVAVLPNDVVDTLQGPGAVIVDEGFLMSDDAARLGAVTRWLCRHSHVARRVVCAWLRHGRTDGIGAGPEETHRDGGTHEAAWQAIEVALDEMQRSSRSAGAELVVVSVPQKGPWGSWEAYPERRLAWMPHQVARTSRRWRASSGRPRFAVLDDLSRSPPRAEAPGAQI